MSLQNQIVVPNQCKILFGVVRGGFEGVDFLDISYINGLICSGLFNAGYSGPIFLFLTGGVKGVLKRLKFKKDIAGKEI